MERSKPRYNCAYTKLVELNKLIPHPDNANDHPQSQIKWLADIIDYQGQRSPIVVSTRSGFITKGHGRLMALKELQWEKAAVDFQDYESEAMEYADIQADNAIALQAELNLAKINEDFVKYGPELDIRMLGIEGFELEPIEKLDPLTDEDEVPEVKHDPITKRGDVWLLGDHRLLCGDSTMIDDVEKLMNGEKADMVFTDPPYGIDLDTNYVSNEKVRGNSYSKIIDDDKEYSAAFLCEYFGNIEQFWWGANYYQETLPKGGSWVVWDKSNVEQDKAIGSDFEICYSLKKHKNRFYRKLWKGFTAKERNERRVHPTQKPIDMIKWFFDEYGKESSLVVDNFLGSGSTLIACEKTNRKCYGMELDEKYCDVIINRYMDHTGRDDVILESTGEKYNEIKESRV